MRKIKLTGKYIGDGSSYIEFEATELLDDTTADEIRDMGYDGFWQGTGETFDKSIIIGFDEMSYTQYRELKKHLGDSESKTAVHDQYRNFK